MFSYVIHISWFRWYFKSGEVIKPVDTKIEILKLRGTTATHVPERYLCNLYFICLTYESIDLRSIIDLPTSLCQYHRIILLIFPLLYSINRFYSSVRVLWPTILYSMSEYD